MCQPYLSFNKCSFSNSQLHSNIVYLCTNFSFQHYQLAHVLLRKKIAIKNDIMLSYNMELILLFIGRTLLTYIYIDFENLLHYKNILSFIFPFNLCIEWNWNTSKNRFFKIFLKCFTFNLTPSHFWLSHWCLYCMLFLKVQFNHFYHQEDLEMHHFS